MKNITFQAGQRLTFIIILGEGGAGREGALRVKEECLPADWSPLIWSGSRWRCSIHPVLAEVSHKHSRQSLPLRPAAATHDIMLTK